MRKIKYGIIGSGFGQTHIRGIMNLPYIEIVALCDLNTERCKRVAEQYGIPKIYENYKEMLQDKEIEVVVVATSDQTHAKLTVDALEADKHVLCEKPMALDLDECREMIKAADRTGKKLMVGQVCRYTPGFVEAKKLVDQGVIGDLFYVESEYAHDYSNSKGVDEWRVTPERHPIIGGGCHAIDLLRWIAGDPIETSAYSNHKVLTDWPVDDCTIAVFKFPNDVIGKVFCSIGCKRDYTMRTVLYGTKGTIIVNNIDPYINVSRTQVSDDGPVLGGVWSVREHTLSLQKRIPVNDHNTQMESVQFCEAILNDIPVLTDGREGAKTVAVCRAVVESCKTGMPVKIEYDFQDLHWNGKHMDRDILLNMNKCFLKPHEVSKAKLDNAIQKALDKLEQGIPKWTDKFAGTSSVDYKYQQVPNKHWVCGMHTGLYWLAYELTGDKVFRDIAEKHLLTYKERFEKKINLDDHDVGFVFSPACVAAYKITGDERIRQLALNTAEYYYNTSYSQKGNFILRMWKQQDTTEGCRTMMDTLMNAPFLFWAGKESGKQKYTDAALSQNKITQKYLIREDGSTYHHYQFESGTHKPVRGLTWQGFSDDSCWARGHAWGIYGMPIAYAYTGEKFLVDVHRKITYYMLNHLPENLIPYWDLIFIEGDEPRDSSAGAIAVCGMHEMSRLLAEDAPEKRIYDSAAAQMLEAIIDNCTGNIGREYDGLICHVTHARPQGLGIDECAVYGDYFYLEALMRFVNPEWNRYW